MNQKKTRHISFYCQCLCIILTLSACHFKTTKNLTIIPTQETFFENNYFSDTQKDYLYKAKIEAFQNNFGGILVIKKLETEHHRIVFTTEFGAKIFDFEITPTQFKINYIVESLNKKLLIRTLKKDFERLVKENLPLDKKFVDESHEIFQSKWNKRTHFYFFSTKNTQLRKIIQASKFKEKITITLESKEANIADSIAITHQTIPLKIELKNF